MDIGAVAKTYFSEKYTIQLLLFDMYEKLFPVYTPRIG